MKIYSSAVYVDPDLRRALGNRESRAKLYSHVFGRARGETVRLTSGAQTLVVTTNPVERTPK